MLTLGMYISIGVSYTYFIKILYVKKINMCIEKGFNISTLVSFCNFIKASLKHFH